VLQGYLARKTILFVGYDLGDPHFRRLYRKVIARLDKYAQPAYALFEGAPTTDTPHDHWPDHHTPASSAPRHPPLRSADGCA
jgi:SIR2-like domain